MSQCMPRVLSGGSDECLCFYLWCRERVLYYVHVTLLLRRLSLRINDVVMLGFPVNIFMVHSETERYAIDDDGNYVYGCSAFMTRPCDFQWCQPHLMASIISIHLQSCQVFCSQRLLACVLRLSCVISGTRYFKYVKHYHSCECSKCERRWEEKVKVDWIILSTSRYVALYLGRVFVVLVE